MEGGVVFTGIMFTGIMLYIRGVLKFGLMLASWLILTALFGSEAMADETTLIVHYLRSDGQYDGWTLWTWDDATDGDSQELQAVGQDADGLVFHVDIAQYGAGNRIGLLPKYGDWERKDPPDRVWTPEMGAEVWIVGGYPRLLAERPGAALAEDLGAPQFTVHYHRPEGDYGGWTLWTWDDKTEGDSKELRAEKQDDFGLVFVVTKKDYGDGLQIGLLPKYGNWVDKDAPDRIWFPFLGDEVWIVSGDPELYAQRPDISPWVRGGFVDGPDLVTVSLSKSMSSDEIDPKNFALKDAHGEKIPILTVVAQPPTATASAEISLRVGRPFDLTSDRLDRFTIEVKGYRPGGLTVRKILDGPEFTSNQPMGTMVSGGKTTLRVFAPTASRVVVLLYEQPEGGTPRAVEMASAEKGLWEIVLPEDLRGLYYTLKVDGDDPRFHPDKEIIEPYSRCNTAHDGRELILTDETPVAERPGFGIDEAIIYELHIRDFTIDENSGIQHRGKYLGFTEEGTVMRGHPEVKTGLDHLVELGVNTVQIMPIQDFENDETSQKYNWGYMPVHFNSPDGWYATQVYGPARVVEFKKLVDALHRRGIRVVMDVVYNHTAETSPSKVFSFNGLAPGYYYRLKEDGSYWNGSGTGNEFRSEAPMGRKFILDSVEYWVREYQVDGFRFDLMGLIDLETMEQIVQRLRAIDPHLLIYGEPWTGGQTPITPTVKGMQRGKGFAVFGDHFRDALKGGVFDLNPGYVQTGINIDRIKKGIQGSINDFTASPLEAINYVACHDNHTFWDRLLLTTRNRTDVDDIDRIRMDKLGAALVLTSQGLPFLHSGQEMLRTKGGDGNSYNKPDAVNMIRWQWKVDHRDVFEYYRGLIALRKAHPIFRMRTRQEVIENLKFFDDHLGLPVPPRCVAYLLTRGTTNDGWEKVVLLFNPNENEEQFTLPAGRWIVVVDEDEAGSEPVRTGPGRMEKKARVPGRSAMVMHLEEN
jgi:pullulanase